MLTAKQLVCVLEAGLTRLNFLSTLSRAAAAAGLGAGALTPKVVTQLAKAVSPKNRLTLAAIMKMQDDASMAAFELTNRWLDTRTNPGGKKGVGWYYARKDPVLQRIDSYDKKIKKALEQSRVHFSDVAKQIEKSPAWQAEYAAITDDEVRAAAAAEAERLGAEYDQSMSWSDYGGEGPPPDDWGSDYDYGVKVDRNVPRFSGDDVIARAAANFGKEKEPAYGHWEGDAAFEEYKRNMATARLMSKALGAPITQSADFLSAGYQRRDNVLAQKLTYQDLADKGLISPADAAAYEEKSMQVVALAVNQQKELQALEKEIMDKPVTVLDPDNPWSKAAAVPTAPTSSFDMKDELAKHGYGVEPETREPEVPGEYDAPPAEEYEPEQTSGSEYEGYDDEDETKHRSSPDVGERKRRS